MDPLAHTLVGATLAETGLRRRTPLATATLLVGANCPDIDAAARFAGSDATLYFRRGDTHGVAAMVLLPLVVTGGMMLYDRLVRRRRRPDAEPARPAALLGLAYLATLTHPALDLLNTYGVRLLMPFDGRWFYGDALFIVDPWLWLLMAAAVVLARSRRRPSAAAWIVLGTATSALVGLADPVPWPARVAWFLGLGGIVALRLRGAEERTIRRLALGCLGTLVVYAAAMVAGSAVARSEADAWLRARGHPPTRIMAGPPPANPFARDVVAVTADGYRFLRVDWLADPAIREAGAPMLGDVRSDVVRAALAAPSVRGMVTWMRFPSYRVEALPDGGYRVTILDVRYSREGRGFGHAIVELDPDLRPR